MEQYIGIDVAKEELSVFDGSNGRMFKNRRGPSSYSGREGKADSEVSIASYSASIRSR